METSERNEGTAVIRRILELLLVVFIVLKLTGVITWSWWWVLSPLWIPLAIALIVTIIFLILIIR